jgi:hypothetical protein
MARFAATGKSKVRVALSWCAASAAVALAFVACAAGTDRNDLDGIGSGGSPSVSGAGAGSTGTQGQGGPSSSVASSTTGQGGNPMCDEDPCKLVLPQCGCQSGQQCIFQNGQRLCVTDGSDDVGDECSGISCKAGAMCLSLGSLATCRKFCDGDSDCSGFGGVCVIQIGGFERPDDPTFCSDNCDPPSGTGCPTSGKCELGLADDMVTFFTMCGGAGTGTEGAPCTNTFNDCAGGYGCLTNPSTSMTECMRWCNMATPNCSVGTCSPINPPGIIGSIEYGVCL